MKIRPGFLKDFLNSTSLKAVIVMAALFVCTPVSAGQNVSFINVNLAMGFDFSHSQIVALNAGTGTSAAETHDATLLLSLQKKVAPLVESRKFSDAADILRAKLKEFTTPEASQKVCLAIGRLYSSDPDLQEEAIPFFKKAIEIDASANLTLSAKKNLAHAYNNIGKTELAADVYSYDSANKSRTTPSSKGVDDFFMQALDEAQLLQSKGKVSKSLGILKILAQKSPPAYLGLVSTQAQKPASLASHHGDHETAMKLYSEMFANIPELKNNANLLSNQIVASIRSGNDSRTSSLINQFLENHYDDSSAPGFLLFLGGLAHQQRNPDLARKYWQEIINHPVATENEIEVAQENLGLAVPRKQVTDLSKDAKSRKSLIPVIVAVNLLTLLLLATIYFLRKKKVN